MQSVNPARRQTMWGMAALALITVIAVVTALLYLRPPNQKTVAFYTDDAASIQPGETVRIAGILVGKVSDLSIAPNQVRVRMTIDRDAFVGDQSQVQVRMLTVVGGYYVNLIPLGDKPLGQNVIPVERVTMPYSLVQTLTAATKITDNVATRPLRESLDQIQQGLTGPNLSSMTELLRAGNALTDTMDRQRGQLSQILNLSEEYIRSLAGYRDQLRELIHKVAIVEATLVLYGKGFGAALEGFGKMVAALHPVGQFYMGHRDDFLMKLRGWQDTFQRWADRTGLIVRILRRVRDRMENAVDRQNNTPPELLATDFCVPLPGSPC